MLFFVVVLSLFLRESFVESVVFEMNILRD